MQVQGVILGVNYKGRSYNVVTKTTLMNGKESNWAGVRGGVIGVSLVAVFSLAACAPTQDRRQDRRGEPVWSEEAMRRHLRAFNRRPGERVTGSRAYRKVAKYAAKRLRAYGVQPALAKGLLIPYDAPSNMTYVLSVSSPTGAFVTGVDVHPHAATDSGRIEASTASIVPRGASPASVRRLVLTPGGDGAASLRQLRRAGARAVLRMGDLTPRKHRASVPGVVAAQITPSAARRLLGISEAQLERYLTGEEAAVWSMAESAQISVRAEERKAEDEAVNVVGYVAGRQPRYIDEAVLVCADLDALGDVGGVSVRDFRSFGIGAAAMLEAVRNVAVVAPIARATERSLIVAVWSGSQQGHRGLRAYLQDPLWSVDTTRAVYYVGLSPEEEPAVRSMLAERGMELRPIRYDADSLFAPSRYLVPSAERRERAVEAPDPPNPNREAVIERGAGMARELSEVTFQILLGALTGPKPFPPSRPDTLDAPQLLE